MKIFLAAALLALSASVSWAQSSTVGGLVITQAPVTTLLGTSNTWTAAQTFGTITASTYNGNYSVAGPPTQYGENNWVSSYNWPISAAGGCCRTRRWVDTVTVTGSQAGSNVLETNFWDLQVTGTGTLTNEAFNQVHPYAYIGSGVNISGYAGNFEGSALNDGIVNKFNGSYNLYTNGSAATTASYTGFTAGATNNNTAAASLGNFTGFECTGVGGAGSVPTFNWCMVNRDSTASIVSVGGVRIGSLGNSNGAGTLALYGADTSSGTYPFFIKNSASTNLFGVANNGAVTVYTGDLTVSTGAVTTKTIKLNGSSSGTAFLQAPAVAGSPTITIPTTTTTLAGLAVAQTFSADQTIGVHLLGGGSAPTVSSCGTSPSITGTDTAGTVTMGTAAPTACTLTFAVAFTNSPICVANVSAASVPMAIAPTTISTSAVTFTAAAAATSGNLTYHCIGR